PCPDSARTFRIHGRPPPTATLFPYTTLFRSTRIPLFEQAVAVTPPHGGHPGPFGRVSFGSGYGRDALYGFFVENRQHFPVLLPVDRKSTRLNSSHVKISYAVFCLKKKSKKYN